MSQNPDLKTGGSITGYLKSFLGELYLLKFYYLIFTLINVSIIIIDLDQTEGEGRSDDDNKKSANGQGSPVRESNSEMENGNSTEESSSGGQKKLEEELIFLTFVSSVSPTLNEVCIGASFGLLSDVKLLFSGFA